MITRLTAITLWCSLALGSGMLLALSAAYLYLNPQIPPVETLTNVGIKAPLRIYSNDGKLIQEFGERLIPVKYAEIPYLFVRALLDTEDKRFFEHSGVDPVTLVNATWQLVRHQGAITTGASTITMQLVKNISGSKEELFIRKFKEILLAIKLERELSKEEILAFYLNVVPFGKHAYGVQAAANTYYGRNVDELTLAETAMLAGVAKKPEAHNPINGPAAAIKRRNLVLRRMLEQGTITPADHDAAVAAPITADVHARAIELPALYVAEMVRQQLLEEYGRDAYSQGLTVRTTLNSTMQVAAEESLRTSLFDYDRRHGYRGPLYRQLEGTWEYAASPETGYPANWIRTLENTAGHGGLTPAIVTNTANESIEVLLKDNLTQQVDFEQMRWARPMRGINSRGPAPQSPDEVVSVGDMIYLRNVDGAWTLAQQPIIEGALVAIDPKNGAIRALAGGFDFNAQQFNHVTQARRQPGSNFKPFFYSGALENGLTAASIFNDRPIVLPGNDQENVYRPKNSGETFRGSIRLREALFRSINLVSMRVVLDFGADNVVDFVSKFGFDTTTFPHDLQLAFGGGTIALTPLEIARAYAVFANGGHLVNTHFIESITSLSDDLNLQARPPTVCDHCGESPPFPPAQRVLSSEVAYIMDSLLADVVSRGTGRKAYLELKRKDLRGKTGTTNSADIWFSGYNADLVATVWVGHDDNSEVGSNEWGSTAPLQAWTSFMGAALGPESYANDALPGGLVRVRINKDTGLATTADDPDAIFEVFRRDLAPAPPKVNARHSVDSLGEAIQTIF